MAKTDRGKAVEQQAAKDAQRLLKTAGVTKRQTRDAGRNLARKQGKQ